MQRTTPARLVLWCLGLVALLGGLSLGKGGLYADRYEGDMLHLIEIVLRIARGEMPHVDFMTPVGILAVWPIAVFVEHGMGIGMAIHWGQVSVALALLPLAVWVGASRFPGGWAYLYTALVMVLCLALVHGESDPNVSLSMHYNRWAWALAFIALPLAFLKPPGRSRPGLDAAVLGVALAALVLIKVTYFVALVPGIVAMLVLRRDWARLGLGVLVGLGALGLATLVLGWAFWPAYLGDLLATATSENRAYPGRALDQVLTAPLYLGGNLLALLSVVLMRQGGREGLGLGLLLLVPGLIYITFQNFGNDPQWMLLLPLILLMARPERGQWNAWGWDLRQAVTLVAVAMLALASPSLANMAYSPLRHFASDSADFVPVFPRSARHGDFLTTVARAYQVDMQIVGERPGSGLEAYADLAERPEQAEIMGLTLEACSLHNGLVAWFNETARRLEQGGFGQGTRILTADLFSNIWMFSEGIAPLAGGAPWRYGGAPGIDDATHLLVPSCAVHGRTRTAILDAVKEAGLTLAEVQETPLYRLYRIDRSAPELATEMAPDLARN